MMDFCQIFTGINTGSKRWFLPLTGLHLLKQKIADCLFNFLGKFEYKMKIKNLGPSSL